MTNTTETQPGVVGGRLLPKKPGSTWGSEGCRALPGACLVSSTPQGSPPQGGELRTMLGAPLWVVGGQHPVGAFKAQKFTYLGRGARCVCLRLASPL